MGFLSLFLSSLYNYILLKNFEKLNKNNFLLATVIRQRRSINLSSEKKTFMIDKPFMFILINSRQNITMFTGKIVKPDYIVRVHHEEL